MIATSKTLSAAISSRFAHGVSDCANPRVLPEVWSVPLSDREKIDGAGGRRATELKRANRTSLTALFTTKPHAGTSKRAPVRLEHAQCSLHGPRQSARCKAVWGFATLPGGGAGGGSEQKRAIWYKREAYWYERGHRGRHEHARQARRRVGVTHCCHSRYVQAAVITASAERKFITCATPRRQLCTRGRALHFDAQRRAHQKLAAVLQSLQPSLFQPNSLFAPTSSHQSFGTITTISHTGHGRNGGPVALKRTGERRCPA